MKSNIHRFFVFLGIFSLIFQSCSTEKPELKEGIWRATLKTQSGVEIPFNFSVEDSAGQKALYLLNSEEKLRADDFLVTEDSVIIHLPFDSEIRAEKTKHLHGKWIKHLADRDVSMEFHAEPGVSWRFFKTNIKSRDNISGRWSATFINPAKHDTTVAVGEFKQEGTRLTGTFLTPTGDYRFLEGAVSNNKLFLSTFDGSNAYLFTANISNKNTLSNGKFYSGYTAIKNWTATRDEKAILPDPYTLTALKPGYEHIDFTFSDLTGQKVSLSDERFKNKVVIVQFLGSWCPNCLDETAYLAPLYEKYRHQGLEIIGLAYERTKDMTRSRKNVQRLRDRLDVNYPLLITGYTNNGEEVLKSIPALKEFKAFPTTLVIDRKGKVRKIHTGFTGPGTGDHYTTFTNEFEKYINELLREE